jgi:hypothetical protein
MTLRRGAGSYFQCLTGSITERHDRWTHWERLDVFIWLVQPLDPSPAPAAGFIHYPGAEIALDEPVARIAEVPQSQRVESKTRCVGWVLNGLKREKTQLVLLAEGSLERTGVWEALKDVIAREMTESIDADPQWTCVYLIGPVGFDQRDVWIARERLVERIPLVLPNLQAKELGVVPPCLPVVGDIRLVDIRERPFHRDDKALQGGAISVAKPGCKLKGHRRHTEEGRQAFGRPLAPER